MSEFITIKFDRKPNDVVQVTLADWVKSIDPEVVIEALYDLARDEEESWLRWEEMYQRRN